MNRRDNGPKTALVLSGGGALGAYEAGVIHYVRTALPKEIAEETLFQIYSGTSVGAINSAFLASTAQDPAFQGVRIRSLWRDLTDADIYRTDAQALVGFLLKTGFFTATNLMGLDRAIGGKLGGVSAFPFKGVLDTTPFVHFLRHNIFWKEMHRNISRGVIDAVTVCATHMLSGRSVLFIEKREDVPFRQGSALPVFGPISSKHILGSAAIPIIFPLIRINNHYYGDGSLRQNTPLNSAIKLGAQRVLIVSTYQPPDPTLNSADAISTPGTEPTLGDISGQLLDSMFLDKLDYDLSQLRRINFLLKDIRGLFGKNALEKLNAYRRKLDIPGTEIREVRTIAPFVIRPSGRIGAIAARHLAEILRKEKVLSPVQRFFQRIVEGSPEEENHLVSYLLFSQGYMEELIDMGYHDAEKAHDHLVRFFSQEPGSAA